MDVPPVDLTRTITPDAGLPRRLARAFVGFQLRQPMWIVLLSLAGVLVVGSVAVWALTGDAFGLLLTAVLAVFTALLLFLTHRSVLTSARAAYPVGSTVGAGVGDTAFRITSALGASDISYAGLRSVHVHGDALILRMKGSNVHAVMPRALFDEDGVARLRREATGTRRAD